MFQSSRKLTVDAKPRSFWAAVQPARLSQAPQRFLEKKERKKREIGFE